MMRLLPLMMALVLLFSGCSGEETEPTRLYLPTDTPLPATSTPTSPPTAVEATSVPTAGEALVPTTKPSSEPEPTTTSVPPSPTVATATPESQAAELTPTIPPPTPTQSFPPNVALEAAFTGFDNPLYLTYASESAAWNARIFIVEKVGRIMMVETGGAQPLTFLDIQDRVGSSGSEQGLLSVAFPPDFEDSGAFYLNYTDRSGNTVVARYRLSSQDPPRGDPNSEKKMLQITQPAGNHNGGLLKFGPDGQLYIGMGDGGRAGDPWGNAQNPEVLLGKLLRLDVAGADTYRIPSDNPFLEFSDVRSEIWALGLRNPWRFSFDRETGDLYIADVGQNTYEEVDFQPAGSRGGENYGWDVMEGNHCFEPQSGCDTSGLVLPVAEYDHRFGCSITGGYVYRGSSFPQLVGTYFYGDYCSGRLWGLRRDGSGEWQSAELLETGLSISSFGEDAAGEVYVLGFRDGTIYRLVSRP
jgi:glucose/arabinose dehydrogenase